MKKSFACTLLLLILQSKLYAQCTVAIPKWATVVNTNITVAAVADTFWVCSGDTLFGSGVDNVYYVESGGALDMSGIHKTVYLKAGASINCSGIDDTVYYEPGAIISCSGNHFDSLCTQLVFDYSQAPANGCVPTSVAPQLPLTNNEVLQCLPNPVMDELNISGYILKDGVAEIKIFNLVGKEIFSTRLTTSDFKLHLNHLPIGIYFLKTLSSAKMFVKE